MKAENQEKDIICDGCGKIVENERQFIFSKLPEILSFGFSYDSYEMPVKNRITTKIDESIDINPFLFKQNFDAEQWSTNTRSAIQQTYLNVQVLVVWNT